MPSLAEKAKKLLMRVTKLKNASGVKESKSPATRLNHKNMDLEAGLWKPHVELDSCSSRVAVLVERVSELEKSVKQAERTECFYMSIYLLFYDEHTTLKKRMAHGIPCNEEMIQRVVTANQDVVALVDSLHNDTLKP